MIKELKIRVLPKQASSEYNITQAVSQEYAIDLSSIKAIRVLKRSIDARQRQVMINMQLKVYINEIPTDDEYIHTSLWRCIGQVSCHYRRSRSCRFVRGFTPDRTRTPPHYHRTRKKMFMNDVKILPV